MSVLERESAFSEEAAQALFEEARLRTRRRRRRVWLSLAAAGIGLAAVAFAIVDARAGGGPGVIAQTASHPFADVRAFSGHGNLAFISRGRLWVLSGRDGRLRAASPAGDQASVPQFSPDGRWLAFTDALRSGATRLWVAHADGSRPRDVAAGATGLDASWLPDGRLISAGRLWRMTPRGPVRAGSAPAGLVAWASDGSAYAFLNRDMHDGANGSWSETQRLELSHSLRGPRTTWFSNRISFTRAGGIDGGVFLAAVVLPAGHGILLRLDPFASASLMADGLAVYQLKRPGAHPFDVGTTVGLSVSIGRGAFALTRGPNRYAWLTKTAWLCATHCDALPTQPGRLSLDPALAANGSLAYVQAATQNSTIAQADVHRWYATHRLWVLTPGASAPRKVKDSAGATNPVWSADGHSLVYVAENSLWLLPSARSRPVRVASPLFEANVWPDFYGEVDWQSQFAWSS